MVLRVHTTAWLRFLFALYGFNLLIFTQILRLTLLSGLVQENLTCTMVED